MAEFPDVSRWAQLTYASFDEGSGVGGWQVKETRGDISPYELREISAHLVTAFDSHIAMPEYPTPGDIAAQPRRCMHLLAHGDPLGASAGPASAVTAGCTLHAVQAGSDSTGRPGNVFSHAVLDRSPTEPAPRIRPIELWRSFDLLTPYGSRDVLAAQLRDGEYPEPSGLVGRDLVLDFVFDPSTWRIGVLSVLLDAVAEAMAGGRRVALVTAGPDQAAMWIGAVSWCMAPSTARAFSWSVYERAARLRSAFERGVHLACVPREDVESLDPEEQGVIVLDEADMPSLGQPGAAPHRTSAGHEVAATPWSLLAQESLVDAPTASGVLALLDDVDARAQCPLTPAWPLAIAHLASAPDDADMTWAARVAVAEAPGGELDPWLADIVQNAVGARLGTSTADAWNSLGTEQPQGREAALFAAEYVRRALGDPEWLAREGRVPLPNHVHQLVDASTDEAIVRAYDERLASHDPVVLLRTADLGERLGLLGDRERADRTVAALTEHVAPRMLRHDFSQDDAQEAPQVAEGMHGTAAVDPGQAGLADATASEGNADHQSTPADHEPAPDHAGDASEAAGGAVSQDGDESAGAVGVRAADGGLGFLAVVGMLAPRVHSGLVPAALRAALREGARTASARSENGTVPAPTPAPPPTPTPAAGGAHEQFVIASDAAAWIVRGGDRVVAGDVEGVSLAEDSIGFELAVWTVRLRPRARGAGVALAMQLLSRYRSWAWIPPEVRVLEPDSLWHLDELLAVERAFPSGLPGKFFVPNLSCLPSTSQLQQLAEVIAHRVGSREARVATLRLDADAGGARPPTLSLVESLSTIGALWAQYREHFAIDAFGPLALEAALMRVGDPSDHNEWPASWFELLRASAVRPGAADRVATMMRGHFETASGDRPLGAIADVIALDIATEPQNADAFTTPLRNQVATVGSLAVASGERLVVAVVSRLVEGLNEQTLHMLRGDIARRLAAFAGDTSERRVPDFERLVRNRFRDTEPRRGGEGWFRPRVTRQSKEH